MDMGFEQKVRERAYEIWMANGMSEGMALAHWCAAEHDLKGAVKAEPMCAKVAPKKTVRATAAKAMAAKPTVAPKTAAAKPAKTKAASATKAAVKPAAKRMSRSARAIPSPGLTSSAIN